MTWQMEGGGVLTAEERGLQVRLEASRPEDGLGLYKAWVRGAGGRLLLGTLAPEGGELRLFRTVSRTGLERAGCWPVTGGEAVLAFPFEEAEEGWRPEPHPERLCADPLLRAALEGRGDLCVRRRGEEILLSARFQPSRPFPLPLLFCLARVEERGGRPWLVWTLDRAGRPRL